MDCSFQPSVTNFDNFYQIPHHMQQVMLSKATPILAGAIPSFEKLSFASYSIS
jgi:hypothetical protein